MFISKFKKTCFTVFWSIFSISRVILPFSSSRFRGISCKHNFSSSPVEKSPADLSRGCGEATSWWKSDGSWKICLRNSWYSLTHEDERYPAATNFCAQISLAGTQLLNNILVHIPSNCWCEKIGPTILFLDIPHRIPIFLGCRVDWYSCRFLPNRIR